LECGGLAPLWSRAKRGNFDLRAPRAIKAAPAAALQGGAFASNFLCALQCDIELMFSRKSTAFVVVIVLAVCAVIAQAQKMNRIARGVWGGQHISINVGATSAAIEYDCAKGVIDGPLVVDDDGHFNLRGTHIMERGGPIRADENPKGKPASYTGSIKGNTMTLTLKLADEDVETFTLEKGKRGELFKCK
jgi:hypothetical protein